MDRDTARNLDDGEAAAKIHQERDRALDKALE